MKVNQLKRNFLLRTFFDFWILSCSGVFSSLVESTHLSQSLQKTLHVSLMEVEGNSTHLHRSSPCLGIAADGEKL